MRKWVCAYIMVLLQCKSFNLKVLNKCTFLLKSCYQITGKYKFLWNYPFLINWFLLVICGFFRQMRNWKILQNRQIPTSVFHTGEIVKSLFQRKLKWAPQIPGNKFSQVYRYSKFYMNIHMHNVHMYFWIKEPLFRGPIFRRFHGMPRPPKRESKQKFRLPLVIKMYPYW